LYVAFRPIKNKHSPLLFSRGCCHFSSLMWVVLFQKQNFIESFLLFISPKHIQTFLFLQFSISSWFIPKSFKLPLHPKFHSASFNFAPNIRQFIKASIIPRSILSAHTATIMMCESLRRHFFHRHCVSNRSAAITFGWWCQEIFAARHFLVFIFSLICNSSKVCFGSSRADLVLSHVVVATIASLFLAHAREYFHVILGNFSCKKFLGLNKKKKIVFVFGARVNLVFFFVSPHTKLLGNWVNFEVFSTMRRQKFDKDENRLI
jgi:hypothetical protein